MPKTRRKGPSEAHSLPTVYLAGPISGCNHAQQVEWRRDLKARYGKRFRFIDPTETPIGREAESSRFAIAQQDAAAIRSADAVLANMWRESIGTAIGVVEARRAGKVVVVVDRNHIQSTFLAYFSDAVAQSVDEGIQQVRALLEAQARVEYIVKQGGKSVQEFDRNKLVRSLRAACAAAGKNDVLLTAEILPRVMQTIIDSRDLVNGHLSSVALRETILATLKDLESDPIRSREYEGIREAWQQYLVVKDDRKESSRLDDLREAYEGTDWRRRIAAEVALTGQCPMNGLYLCTKFEEAWVRLGRVLRVISDDDPTLVRDLSSTAFFAIGLAADEMVRIQALPKDLPRVLPVLVQARKSRNAVVHLGAFGGSEALSVLEAWEVLQTLELALEKVPGALKRARSAAKRQ